MATTAAVLDILVNARTAKAQAELHKVDRELKKVDKTVTHTDRSMGSFGSRMSGMGGAVNRTNRNFQLMRNTLALIKFPALIAGAGGAAQAFSALGAGAVGLTGALGPLTGALVALPAAFGAAGQGAATALLAFGGLGDALGAMSDAQSKAGQTAVDTGEQQRAAAEAVRAAEQALASSQRSVKFAQEDLTQAREDAARQLVDMRLEAKAAAAGEEGAIISLQRARQALAEVRADPSSTALDLRDALNNVTMAQIGVTSAKVEAKRADKDLRDSEKEGVRGSEQVVSARRALTDAQRSVADSSRQLAEAQRSASEAMKGGGSAADLVAQKMAKLSPSARDFARFLFSLKPQLDKLKQTAASNLFPGLEKGLRSAMANFPVVDKVIGLTAKTMGRTAEQAGKLFGSKAFGRDLGTIGAGNAKVLGRMGSASLNLASALRHVMVAAQPLVRWMSKMTLGWTENIEGAAKAGRENGKLAHFFRQTRKVMEKVGAIAGNLAGAFMQIGKAAAPMGRAILSALERSSGKFEDWTNSMKGKNALKDYFTQSQPAVFEMGRLIGDLVKGFFSLSQSPGLSNLIRQVRKDLLPVLLELVRTTTKEFLPVLVRFGIAWAKMMAFFLGSTGPLNHFIRTLTSLADLFNVLPKGIKSAAGSIVAFGLVMKALSFGATMSGLSALAARFGLVKTQAAGAAGASSAATGSVGGTGKVAAPTTTRGKLKSVAGAAATGVGAIVGFQLASEALNIFTRRMEDPASGLGARLEQIGTTLGPLTGTLGGLGDKLAGVFDIKLPEGSLGGMFQAGEQAKALQGILAKMGGVGTLKLKGLKNEALALARELGLTTPQVRELIATFKTEGITRAEKSIRRLGDSIFETLPKAREAVEINARRIEDSLGKHSKAGKEALSKNFFAGVRSVRRAMDLGLIATEEGGAYIAQLFRRQLRLYGISAKDILDITPKNAQDIPKLGPMPPPGKQAGGMVVGGSGSGDKVPLRAMVEPGERIFVLNRNASGALADLQGLNSAVPRFAKGGEMPHYRGKSVLGHGIAGGLNKVSGAAEDLVKSMRSASGAAGGFGGIAGSGTKLMKAISKRKGWNFADWWEIDRRESGHGTNLVNPTSTARLRGQFLDMNWGKYGPGSDPTPWPSMRDQIISMARYIAERYGNPTKALAQHDAVNWYQQGGVVPHLATGGYVQGAQKPSGGATSKGILTLAKYLFNKGYSATSGGEYRGSGTGHDQQWAIDWGDSVNSMSRLWATLLPLRGGLEELYGPPGLFERGVAFSNAGLLADHQDHVHTGAKAAIIAPLKRLMGQGAVTAGATGSTAPQPRKKLELTKAQKRRLNQLTKKIRKIGGLDKALGFKAQGKLDEMSGNAELWGEYADRASQLTDEETGVLGIVNGLNEQQWVEKQLTELFRLRNALIRAQEAIASARAKIVDKLRKLAPGGVAKGSGKELSSSARKSLHDRLKKELKKPKRKQNASLISSLQGQLSAGAKVPGQKVAFNKKALADLQLLDSTMATKSGELGEVLLTTQGAGSPMGILQSLPALGTLGGSIFDAQIRLKELGVKPSISDSGTESESAELLRQLLREANQRFAVSQAQYPILQGFKGMFALGGHLAMGQWGVAGETGRPELVTGPATIHSPAQSASMLAPEVNVTFTGGAEFLRNFIKVEVQRQGKRDARGVGRTPGSAGSLRG